MVVWAYRVLECESMKKSLFKLIPLFILCSCNIISQIEESTQIIEENRSTIENSTHTIAGNAQAVAESSEFIKENERLIIQLNEVIQESSVTIKENQRAVAQSTQIILKNAQAVDSLTEPLRHLNFGTLVLLAVIILCGPALILLMIAWFVMRK